MHYGITCSRKAALWIPRHLPLLNHPLHAPTVFRPEELVQAVRDQRQPEATDMPEICVLDFDGDLTDALVNAHEVQVCEAWSCFHTSMWSLTIDGQRMESSPVQLAVHIPSSWPSSWQRAESA